MTDNKAEIYCELLKLKAAGAGILDIRAVRSGQDIYRQPIIIGNEAQLERVCGELSEVTGDDANIIADAIAAHLKEETVAGASSHTGDADEPYLIDSRTFAETKYHQNWLIENVLVAGQPATIAGPKKCLKTSLIVEAAMSLGTGKPFLNQFRIPMPTRAAILSGESGAATLQETAERICRSVDD